MIDPDSLARLALFADLRGPDLQEVADQMEEERHAEGDRVLREGLSGNAFYVVVDGAAAVVIGGQERARLGAGEFFGEISILTGEPAAADVVAASDDLRVAVLPAAELRPLLVRHPALAIRMLEMGARRLRTTNTWLA
jgi:CRP/FNR family transcriptional regulator, cyclic AMP receptor protein